MDRKGAVPTGVGGVEVQDVLVQRGAHGNAVGRKGAVDLAQYRRRIVPRGEVDGKALGPIGKGEPLVHAQNRLHGGTGSDLRLGRGRDVHPVGSRGGGRAGGQVLDPGIRGGTGVAQNLHDRVVIVGEGVGETGETVALGRLIQIDGPVVVHPDSDVGEGLVVRVFSYPGDPR